MKTINGIIVLDDAQSYSPTSDSLYYTDTTGIKFLIPMKLLVRLYEGTKHISEKRGVNWEEYCNSLFNNKG